MLVDLPTNIFSLQREGNSMVWLRALAALEKGLGLAHSTSTRLLILPLTPVQGI